MDSECTNTSWLVEKWTAQKSYYNVHVIVLWSFVTSRTVCKTWFTVSKSLILIYLNSLVHIPPNLWGWFPSQSLHCQFIWVMFTSLRFPVNSHAVKKNCFSNAWNHNLFAFVVISMVCLRVPMTQSLAWHLEYSPMIWARHWKFVSHRSSSNHSVSLAQHNSVMWSEFHIC